MFLKSTTTSRKAIDVANRIDQSCSYSVLEELETSLANNLSKDEFLIPPEIKIPVVGELDQSELGYILDRIGL